MADIVNVQHIIFYAQLNMVYYCMWYYIVASGRN